MTEHTAKEVLAILKKAKFKYVGSTGDHHHYKNNKGYLATVAYSSLKDTIPSGTYKSIMRQINGEIHK